MSPPVHLLACQEQLRLYWAMNSTFELCKICADTNKDVRIEPCGHLLCSRCLDAWQVGLPSPEGSPLCLRDQMGKLGPKKAGTRSGSLRSEGLEPGCLCLCVCPCLTLRLSPLLLLLQLHYSWKELLPSLAGQPGASGFTALSLCLVSGEQS